MKFKIGSSVMCYPKDGSMEGWEFWARIADYSDAKRTYLVEDQDSDFFELEEDEMELEND